MNTTETLDAYEAVVEALMEERPVTFLGTLDADCIRLRYYGLALLAEVELAFLAKFPHLKGISADTHKGDAE